MKRALSYPLKLIAKNAGVNGSVVVEKVDTSCKIGFIFRTRCFREIGARFWTMQEPRKTLHRVYGCPLLRLLCGF